jgi:DNA-binding IclR family transcriptional regulator
LAVTIRARPENYNLESVARTVAVLRALEGSTGRSLDQVAQSAQLSESTTLRYLSSLANHDLVERDGVSGVYRLGLSLFRLGGSAISQRDLTTVAAPTVADLTQRFEETVNLAARRSSQVIVVQVAQSPRSFRKGVAAGGADSWHATSLGKALLAALDDEEAAKVLGSAPLPQYTPNTLADREALRRDLLATRGRGYAIDDEESEEGLRCVGVAIRDHTGSPTYAISISGPKSRMPFGRINQIGEHLVQVGADIAAQLGYSG